MSKFVLAGQFIIGVVFVVAVVGDIIERNKLISLLSTKLESLLKKKLPYTHYLFYGAAGLKVVCGLALIFNILVPLAAFLLAALTIIINIVFNNFWALQGEERKTAYGNFIVNWAVIGGLIALIGV
jgi:uncharacterized membrane protein YphA (DoxX/SURF4 family)